MWKIRSHAIQDTKSIWYWAARAPNGVYIKHLQQCCIECEKMYRVS